MKHPKRNCENVGNTTVWYDSEVFEVFQADWFEPEHWRQQNALTGQAAGRGTTHFFAYHGNEYVLRHYRRGGLVGKLLNDEYLFTGMGRTRAWRELSLLLRMCEMSLPVPKPVAARVVRNGLIYRADLICEKIPRAQDLHQLLCQGSLDNEIWSRVGATIAMFHRQQIFHHDLNIHNIMLDDQEKVWLIDFDRCAQRPGDAWKQANLQRLHRSLVKEQNKHHGYGFTEPGWNSLLSGYAQ